MGDFNELDKIVPYFVHEGMMVRQERTIKRLWILCIIIFLAFVISNGAWIYYESQWETVTTENTTTTTQEVSQDSESGSNQFIGGDYYGETKDKNIDN